MSFLSCFFQATCKRSKSAIDLVGLDADESRILQNNHNIKLNKQDLEELNGHFPVGLLKDL